MYSKVSTIAASCLNEPTGTPAEKSDISLDVSVIFDDVPTVAECHCDMKGINSVEGAARDDLMLNCDQVRLYTCSIVEILLTMVCSLEIILCEMSSLMLPKELFVFRAREWLIHCNGWPIFCKCEDKNYKAMNPE